MPRELLEKICAWENRQGFAHIPIAQPKKLVEADAIVLGSPTRYGASAAQMQAFLDSTGEQWISGEKGPASTERK
ncbi:hypothetical protein SH139x_002568 [Planctomycetaceae bacterium SH139]